MKYMQKDNKSNTLTCKHGASNLWKGICKTEEILKDGIRKMMRSGKNTSFWHDRSIIDKPLYQICNSILEEDEANLSTKLLPDAVLKDLSYYELSEEEYDSDEVYWDRESLRS